MADRTGATGSLARCLSIGDLLAPPFSGNATRSRMMYETRDGGCHCGRVRFRARVDLDQLSQCSCTICTKKGILHLTVMPQDFDLLSGKDALAVYTFGTGVAQHTFCAHCGMHAFYIP